MSNKLYFSSIPSLSCCQKNQGNHSELLVSFIVSAVLLTAGVTLGITRSGPIGGCFACGATGLLTIAIGIHYIRTHNNLPLHPNYDFSKIIKLKKKQHLEEKSRALCIQKTIIRAEIAKTANITEEDLPKNFFAIIQIDKVYYIYVQKESQETDRRSLEWVSTLTNNLHEIGSELESFLKERNSKNVPLEDLLGFFRKQKFEQNSLQST